MKKLLVLFVALDLIFVGVIVKISSPQQRTIASNSEQMTEGQKQKEELIQSFVFSKQNDSVVLKTENLQSLCASYKYLKIKFKANEFAVSGQAPLIINSYSCDEILKNSEQDSLSTDLKDFTQLRKTKAFGSLSSVALFADEELPTDWKFFEFEVTGDDPQQDHFTVNEAELNTYLGNENLIFQISTSQK